MKLSYDYGCVMAVLPEELSREIYKFGLLLDDSEIYGLDDPEKGREEESHITVKYGLQTNEISELRGVIFGFGVVRVTLGVVSRFENDVLKIEVESDDLAELNKLISDNFECKDSFPVYTPHLTIAYIQNGAGKDLDGRDDFKGKVIDFYGVVYSMPNGVREIIDLVAETKIARGILCQT